MNHYKLILCDPPWTYQNKNTGGSMNSGSANKYSTLTTDEICALPIHNICDKNCVLALWVTTPLMEEGIKVINSWKFKFKTKIYWRKIMSMGLGYYLRGQCEELWICTKGKVKPFRLQKSNFIQSKALKHSHKPEEARQLLELTEITPRIELFATEKHEGWDCVGNKIDGTDIRNWLNG